MTAVQFLLFQASAPIPLKFYFLLVGVIVLIIGILIFAYRSYIKSPEPTEDEMSALHIGTNRAPAIPQSPSPATRKQPPVVQHTAKLSTPAPVENKVIPPPITVREPIATVPPPPITVREPVATVPPPPITMQEPGAPITQTTQAFRPDNATSLLHEELPSSAPRTLAPPKVFSPSTPRQEIAQTAPQTAIPVIAPVVIAPVIDSPQPRRVNEHEVFGSLTEVQQNQSRSNRFTLLILLVAVIGGFIVGFTQVPSFHDMVMSGYDKVTGHNPPPPPAPQIPKIEIEQKVTLAGPTLFIEGRVRNISEGTLDNLFAEVTVFYVNGKLSETRLIPIVAGTGAQKPVVPAGKDVNQTPVKEDRILPPSQGGKYLLELPSAIYHEAQLKRILKDDGSEVMHQKH